jgi:hypothetical protein
MNLRRYSENNILCRSTDIVMKLLDPIKDPQPMGLDHEIELLS